MTKKSNSLINASSPYLLQHAYNPVEWNEWNSEILKKSKSENKLLIISIGYAACHWCHVMEHESFENEEVAEWMNNFYINIKVDREERPDIDAVYMNAAQLTTGRGGWPLNVIALPDGRPVFAGTYFPKDSWIKILHHFATAWKKKPEELIEVAIKIQEGLNLMEDQHFPKNTEITSLLDHNITERIVENIFGQLDLAKGGLDKAPKFPMPCIFDFLLNTFYFSKNEKIMNAIHATLTNMMRGGIYDHVGGGFARYSTDAYWFVPHFEKMMYDNSQLVSLYSKAYALTGVEDYKKIADEIIDWIHKEMTNIHSHLFYSSLDADSEGAEGKFYCFTKAEINSIVSYRPDIFCAYYSIKDEGNWEHSNILCIGKTIPEMISAYSITKEMLLSIIDTGKEQLYIARKERIRPGLDNKCITVWNAMTITSFLRAFQFHENYFALANAQEAQNFLLEKLRMPNGLFYRNYTNEKASIPGFLDDQAFIIEMLIELYRTHWDEKYLLEAKNLLEKVMDHFFDSNNDSFYFTGKNHEQPVVRTKEIMDNVVPSSNSVMANNLFILGHYFYNDEWINISKNICIVLKDQALKYGPYFSNWANVMLAHCYGGFEIAITGPATSNDLKELYKIPGAILMRKSEKDTIIPLLKDKPLTDELQIYLCKDKTCNLPVNNVGEVIKEIQAGLAS